jgi:hypothetical protein
MHLPAYEHERILREQKYPREAPNAYRVPYYRPALNAIRAYYTSGNDRAVLTNAVIGLQGGGGNVRRIQNNVRIIERFRNGRQAVRPLKPQRNPTFDMTLDGVDIRLTWDLTALENQADRRILYNFRVTAIEAAVARTTLDLSRWILEEQGLKLPTRSFEYVDLQANQVHSLGRAGAITRRRAHQSARFIRTLWEII